MLSELMSRLRDLLHRSEMEGDLDEELHYHIERQTEQNIRLGMNPEEAHYAARKAFGGVELAKERSRDVRGLRWIEELWQDLRYGARMLVKQPSFTLIAMLALALGVGANTAIFSVVNTVLLKPLPFYDQQRLVFVTEDKRGKHIEWEGEFAGSIDYILWQAESKAFDHLAAFNWGNIYLTRRGEPERLDSIWATANLFPTLGVGLQLGRTFTPEEDRPGGARVVILSHSFWQRRFGGDPAIIGQSLTLDGESRQVIGVMPPGFKFIHRADVLLPLAIDVQRELARNVNGSRYGIDDIIGRLKPGVSVNQARSELDSILQRGK